MAEEGEDVRTSETIRINILRCRQLRGVKGDSITSYVHADFDNKSLGDSSKVDSTPESEAEYNFSASFECTFTEVGHTFDDVAYKPVIITVNEVLPKEKKQKDEKTSVIGQCTVDLLPLLNGELRVESTLQLHPVVGSPMENLPPDIPKAEIDVVISVNEQLLESSNLTQSNLLTVRVGSAYSLPDSWSLLGAQYNYAIGMPIPTAAEKEIPLIFTNGSLKPGAEKEMANRPLKWFNLPNVTSAAQYIPSSVLERLSPDEEKGDLKQKDALDFRRDCENEKNRVTWDTERRYYLEPNARAVFQNKIAETRLWPVEIMRMPPPAQPKAAGGGKKDKGGSVEEDHQISFHGVCYVDLGPLLYPGVKKVAGAFLVQPFNDHDLADKTKRKQAIANDVIRVNSSISRMTGSSPVQKGGKGTASVAKDTPSKKSSAVMRPTDTGSEGDGIHHNIEGEMYLEARTFVYLEFILHQPLVPRREPEQLAKLVSEYIPPRPPFKRAVGGAQKAVEDFHNQIGSVSTMVLNEFRNLFGEEILDSEEPQNPEKQEERRKQLLFKLNSSGKYFAFKEQIKHSIVKIVREKYMKTTAFTDKGELQEFLSELYVYLIDEMHESLEKVLLVGDQYEGSPRSFADSEQLKRFAQEAEVNEEYDDAAMYYQERLTKDKNDPEHWFDYGTFNLLIGDYSKAAECFKESVSINQTFTKGLLMYGILCAMEGDKEEAETVFERTTGLTSNSSDLPSCLSWTILALFYDNLGNEIRAEHSYAEARQRNATAYSSEHDTAEENDTMDQLPSKGDLETVTSSLLPPSAGAVKQSSGSVKSASTTKGNKTGKRDGPGRIKSSAENSTSSKEILPNDQKPQSPLKDESAASRMKSIFLRTSEWLLDMKALKFAEIALSHELLDPLGGPGAEYHVALARLHMMRKEYTQAEENLNHATRIDHQHPDAWAITGHLHYVTGNLPSARDCYERTLAFIADASEMHAIYLRLGTIYIMEEEYLKAKETFLLACKYSPSCVSWLGVGIACYRLNELSESEDALAEANLLNNSNPEVWAYLSLVCLQTERKLEAEQSYKYAMNLKLKDEDLIHEIHLMQKKVGFGNPSF
ncbi:cilia- and flagella-associated protein 70-like [Styela clava]